jgi:transposase InsO family protein
VVHPDQLYKASLGVCLFSGASECVNPLHSGWDLGRSLNQELTQVTLQTALIQHTPGIHHSGQRVQYAATAYVQLLEETGVQISMAEVGQAWHKELC